MSADFWKHSGHDLMAFPLDRLQPYAFLVGQLGRPQPADKDGLQSRRRTGHRCWAPSHSPPSSTGFPPSTLAHILLQLTGLGLPAPLAGLVCPYLSGSLAEEPLACKVLQWLPLGPLRPGAKAQVGAAASMSEHEDTGCPPGTQTPRDICHRCL